METTKKTVLSELLAITYDINNDLYSHERLYELNLLLVGWLKKDVIVPDEEQILDKDLVKYALTGYYLYNQPKN